METSKNSNIKIKKSLFDDFTNKVYLSYNNIKENKIFKYSFILLFIKTILFILLISSDKAVSIGTNLTFHSVLPILVYISFISLSLSFAFLFKGLCHLWFFTVSDILITTIYIADLWYYRSNHAFLSYHMLKATSNLNNLSDSVLAMGRRIDILFILDILVLIILSIKYSKIYKNTKRNLLSFLILFLLPVLYLTYVHYKVDVLKKGFENEFIFKTSWSQNQTMASLTPIGYHIFDLYRYYEECQPYKLSKSEENEIKNLNVKLICADVEDMGQVFLVFLIKSFYPPEEYYEKGIHTTLFHYERQNPNAKVQIGDFKMEVAKKLESEKAFEALLVNKSGYIPEGSRSNMFFVKGDKLYTAPKGDVLLGITRKHIFQVCEELGIEIIEENIHVGDLNKLDGAFMTGTSVNVLPISTIDHIKLDSINNKMIKEINNGYVNKMMKYIEKNQ